MGVDLFSLRLNLETTGVPQAKAGLESVEAAGAQTTAALNQGAVSMGGFGAATGQAARQLNAAESAALNGTKGFKSFDFAAAEASNQQWILSRNAKLATDEVEKGTRATGKHAEGLKGMIAPLKAVAEAYLVFEAIHFVEKSIDQAAALHELSQKTGASVEMLSVLEFAGRRANVTTGNLTMAFRGLGLSLGNLERGQKVTAEAFGKIGLSATDFIGLNTDQAFHKIVESMSRLPDGLEKSEVASRLFGRAGAELVPLLDDLARGGFARVTAEAEKFHAVISTKVAEDADKLKDQWGDLVLASQGLVRQVIPAITSLAKALTDLFSTGPGDEWRNTMRELSGIKNLMVYGAYASVVQNAEDFAAPSRQKAMRDARAGHIQKPGDVALAPLSSSVLDTIKVKAESAESALRRLELLMGNPAQAPKDLGNPFARSGPIGTRNDRIDVSGALHAPSMEGSNRRSDDANRVYEDTLRAGEAARYQFATLGQNLGRTLADGLAAGMGAALKGKNPFKAFGNIVLQGLGSIMSQMGHALMAYGVTMLKLLPFLTNIFTSGPAAIAAGIALTALGAALGSAASGGGGSGGGGGGFASRDQITQIHLTADGAGGLHAPTPRDQPIYNVLGQNSPEGQRIFGEYGANARRRGIR